MIDVVSSYFQVPEAGVHYAPDVVGVVAQLYTSEIQMKFVLPSAKRPVKASNTLNISTMQFSTSYQLLLSNEKDWTVNKTTYLPPMGGADP